MKCLKQIGETRWLGKANAAKAIFGTYSQPSISTFVDLLLCFAMIKSSDGFDAKARRDAEILLSHFLQFETLLTIFMYFSIFEITVPVSTYLQTAGLNLFQANH